MWRKYWARNLALSFDAWDARATMVTVAIAGATAVLTALGSHLNWIPPIVNEAVTGIVSGAGVIVISVAILTLFVTPARTWGADQTELAELRRGRIPKLEIVFDAAKGRPYVQDKKTVAGQEHFVIQRQIRVGIRNVSDQVVAGAHLVLESCEPVSEHVYPGHALRQQGTGTEYFDVHPGDAPSVFVDVLVCLMSLPTWEASDPTAVEVLNVCYVANLLARLPLKDHVLVLRVEGSGTSTRQTFRAAIVGPTCDFSQV